MCAVILVSVKERMSTDGRIDIETSTRCLGHFDRLNRSEIVTAMIFRDVSIIAIGALYKPQFEFAKLSLVSSEETRHREPMG